MKKLLGFILDLLFFVSFLAALAMLTIFVLYKQQNDIAIINFYLQTQLLFSMLAVYSGIVIAVLIYFWLIPSFLKGTVGQRLAGTSYISEQKVNAWTIFLKNIIGSFWNILLFPYSLVVAILRKPSLSTRLSGIQVQAAEGKLPLSAVVVAIVFALFLVATAGASTYVYKQGVTTLIERYTDYEKQMHELIDMFAYQDARNTLEKYKQYHGEDSNYSYYRCIIEANLTIDLANLALCDSALAQNSSDTERTMVILAEQAKLNAANDLYKEADVIYARLWNEFNDRSDRMKNYVAVLSELGKSKEATDILNELATKVDATDPLALRDLGNLYERIGQVDLAIESYTKAAVLIPDGENESLAGELYYSIGVIQYGKNKLTEAQASFEKAKELNKDYADSVDSYIILISKLKNSVTK